MKSSKRTNLILNYLDELYQNPVCELNYSKPYELVIAVMLSAQTTDKRVNIVTHDLFLKYPSLKDLKNAEIKDLENIIRSLGSYKKKAYGIKEIAKILDEKYNGEVPCDRESLESLPMVGRKTTNVILSEIFDVPNIAVDTHVFRVSKRLKLAFKNDDVLEVEKRLKKKINKDRWSKFHLQMVLFGRYHCTAKKPECSNCKLKSICNYKEKGN